MKRLSDRERVAYHEAGHAVMRYELRLPFKRVSIVPDGETLTVGRVQHQYPPTFRPDCNTDLRTEGRIKHEVMAALAGELAETYATGHRDWWALAMDSQNAFAFAAYVTASGDEAAAYIRWLWERTKLYLARPWVWPRSRRWWPRCCNMMSCPGLGPAALSRRDCVPGGMLRGQVATSREF